MIEKFSDSISLRLYKTGKIQEGEVDRVAFAIELIVTHVICFSSIFILGIITNKMLETTIFLFCFIVLRKENTGYHAQTFKKCFILTNLIYIICTLIMPLLYKQSVLWLICPLILIDLMIYIKNKSAINILSIGFTLSALIVSLIAKPLSIIILSTIIVVKTTDRKSFKKVQ